MRNITRICGMLAAAAAISAGGCASDLESDASNPRNNRVSFPPVERNSALGEMKSQTADSTPILSVEFPNTKDEQPVVHTIADGLNPKSTAPPVETGGAGQQPAMPSPKPPPRIHVDPVNGPGD